MSQADIDTYQDYLTIKVAEMDMRAGWVYQMHMCVIRDVRDTLFQSLGMDVGATFPNSTSTSPSRSADS